MYQLYEARRGCKLCFCWSWAADQSPAPESPLKPDVGAESAAASGKFGDVIVAAAKANAVD